MHKLHDASVFKDSLYIELHVAPIALKKLQDCSQNMQQADITMQAREGRLREKALQRHPILPHR